ncbi:MAG: TonB C-terminal domain-containing protein [Candidatus Acidiferrales bacterium]
MSQRYMIPRFLVPTDVRPVDKDAPDAPPPRRLSTTLDGRTIVPANLPHLELDTRTTIPAYMPLDVLAARVVIPRDAGDATIDTQHTIPDYVPITITESRVVIPERMEPVELKSKPRMSASELPDLVEPDVMTTGEVNLMDTPVEERISAWKRLSRFLSIAAHAALILFIFVEPKLFPYRPPSTDQLNLAQNELTWANLPALSTNSERSSPRSEPSPQVRVSPRALQQAAPPEPEAPPQPMHAAPSEQESALPAAPTPQPQQPAPTPQPQEMPSAPMAPAPQPNNNTGLVLPKINPGTSPDQLRERGDGGGTNQGFEAPLPGQRRSGGQGYPGGGGGNGEGVAGGLQMLTPTQGVDFSSYLARVLDSVRRNWYAIMPESVYMGEKGRVILDFKIQRDGSVPGEDPELRSSSQKEPLDRAASSSIRASSPFEPLPPAFSGPYIELRFIFLYNIPESEAGQTQ